MHSGFSPPDSGDSTVTMNTDHSSPQIDASQDAVMSSVNAAPFVLAGQQQQNERLIRSRSSTPRVRADSHQALLPPPGFPLSLGPNPVQQQLLASSNTNVSMPVQLSNSEQVAAQNAQQHVQVVIQPPSLAELTLIQEHAAAQARG